MSQRLSPPTRAAIRSGWSRKLEVPADLLGRPGVHLLERGSATAVVVLELERTVVVLAPPSATAALARLDATELLDISALLASLAHLTPRAIGTASLAYAEAVEGAGLGRGPAEAGPAGVAEAEALLSECAPAERDESGLVDMPFRFVCRSADGRPVALSGYEAWGGSIAQLGVLTRASDRRRGFAQRVAVTAARSALGGALVPQWRCRLGNDASARLGRRLGFAPYGRQLALELPAPAPPRTSDAPR